MKAVDEKVVFVTVRNIIDNKKSSTVLNLIIKLEVDMLVRKLILLIIVNLYLINAAYASNLGDVRFTLHLINERELCSGKVRFQKCKKLTEKNIDNIIDHIRTKHVISVPIIIPPTFIGAAEDQEKVLFFQTNDEILKSKEKFAAVFVFHLVKGESKTVDFQRGVLGVKKRFRRVNTKGRYVTWMDSFFIDPARRPNFLLTVNRKQFKFRFNQ